MVEALKLALGWLHNRTKEQVLAMAAFVSLFAYALLYVVYFQFYTSFGLSPSDVGLTRVRLLEESLIGFLLVPFSWIQENWHWVAFVLAVTVGVRLLLCLTKIWIGNWFTESLATGVVVFVLICATAFAKGYLQSLHDARTLGSDVRKEGFIVTDWVHHRPDSYYPYLQLRAIPVDVHGAPPDVILTSGCTLYLGASDKHVVMFDVRRQTVVRLRVDSVDMTLHPALHNYVDERLPVRCLDDTGNKAE